MQTLDISSLLNKKFVGTDELRRDLTKILNQIPKGQEVVITQHGKPKVVMVDINTYLKIQELKDELADYDPKLVKRVNQALKEAKKGYVEDTDQVFKKLGF